MQHARTAKTGTGAAALDVAGVSHSYGPKRALNDVSFSIAPATFTALLGLNGAGKTTVFNCITGFYKPSEGMITLS
ncbi:MAG: ATP-binding cassette domain-containing protein, partial [Mesorhizobium sp.]